MHYKVLPHSPARLCSALSARVSSPLSDLLRDEVFEFAGCPLSYASTLKPLEFDYFFTLNKVYAILS